MARGEAYPTNISSCVISLCNGTRLRAHQEREFKRDLLLLTRMSGVYAGRVVYTGRVG